MTVAVVENTKKTRAELVAAVPAVQTPTAFRFSPKLLTLSEPMSPGAEAIRALRTHVLTQHVQQGRRALAMCAASYGVGCSSMAVNLAISLAQIGVKTLLVDADLREPMVDQLIQPSRSPSGLAQCLASADANILNYIEEDVFPDLSVLYAGHSGATSHELLARETFGEVMNQCLRDFDMTIVDTPAANTSADARRISNVVGYSLVIARRNKSLVSDVKTLVDQLTDDGAKVIGTVLNAD